MTLWIPCWVYTSYNDSRYCLLNELQYKAFGVVRQWHEALDEGSLIDVIVSVIPMKWKTELVREQYDPAAHSIDDVEVRLEMLEVGEDLERATLKPRDFVYSKDKTGKKNAYKSHQKGKTDAHKKYVRTDTVEKGSDTPPCKLCQLLGGNADSHGTNDCFKKRAFEKKGTGSKRPEKNIAKYQKRKYVSAEEVNALVMKKTKKSLKKITKKNGLQYSSSSESSDTES